MVRQRPAKPLYSGSNPDAASNSFLSPCLVPHGGFSTEFRHSHTETSLRASGGIGIHDGLKIRSPQGDAGSIPASPTNLSFCQTASYGMGVPQLHRAHEAPAGPSPVRFRHSGQTLSSHTSRVKPHLVPSVRTSCSTSPRRHRYHVRFHHAAFRMAPS